MYKFCIYVLIEITCVYYCLYNETLYIFCPGSMLELQIIEWFTNFWLVFKRLCSNIIGTLEFSLKRWIPKFGLLQAVTLSERTTFDLLRSDLHYFWSQVYLCVVGGHLFIEGLFSHFCRESFPIFCHLWTTSVEICFTFLNRAKLSFEVFEP